MKINQYLILAIIVASALLFFMFNRPATVFDTIRVEFEPNEGSVMPENQHIVINITIESLSYKIERVKVEGYVAMYEQPYKGWLTYDDIDLSSDSDYKYTYTLDMGVTFNGSYLTHVSVWIENYPDTALTFDSTFYIGREPDWHFNIPFEFLPLAIPIFIILRRKITE